ncbi:MAG: glucose-1-phosphate adenylyltransferase subunit GlgD [Fusobacteriaceae bacterium]
MLNNYMALILLENPLDDMKSLVKQRTHASLPLGGRYRLIDFHLSNAVNSGISNVGIIGSLKNSSSLTDHVSTGAPWDLDRKNGGIFFLEKYNSRQTDSRVRDFETNLNYFYRSKQKNVLIMSSDMIYNIDFKKVFDEHESDDRELTVVYKHVDNIGEKFYQAATVNLDGDGSVSGMGINLLFSKEQNISLGAFVISKKLLISLMGKQIERNEYGCLKELIIRNIPDIKTKGFGYSGYVAQIKSVKDYYDFNMDLLFHPITDDLFRPELPIYTKRKDTPPTLFKKDCSVENSMISNGCQIMGTVRNSVIGRRVTVEKGAVVENCVIMQNCIIKSGAHLRSLIVDKGNTIVDGLQLNSSPAYPLVIEKSSALNKNLWDNMIKGDKHE